MRPFAPEVLALRATPRQLALGLTLASAPLLAWLAFVDARLAAAWAVACVVICSALVRLAAEVRSQAAEVERLRSTDALTGLPNRRVWEDALPRELARSIRIGSPVAVAILAIDDFDDYNDDHGRRNAELLLKEIAALWPGELRESDLLARYGADEFTLLLPDCGPADMRDVVDKVRQVAPPGVTCSAGVAAWDGVEEPDSLVRRADAALAASKRAGHGRTVVAGHGPRPEPAGA